MEIQELEEIKKDTDKKICKDFDYDCLDMTEEQCVCCWCMDCEDYCIMIMN